MKNLIKMKLECWGNEDLRYLPLEPNMEKFNCDTFEELKVKLIDAMNGYGTIDDIKFSLVKVLTESEYKDLQNQLVIVGFEKPTYVVVDFDLGGELVECTETKVLIFKSQAKTYEFYDKPSDEEPWVGYFASDIHVDAYIGIVYSKDFAYFNCDCCGRTICEQSPSNGYMTQYRMDDESAEMICTSCHGEQVLEGSVDIHTILETKKLKGGDFYSDSELEEAGFEKVSDFDYVLIGMGRYSNGYSEEDFFERLEDNLDLFEGYSIAIQYESLSIGASGGYVTFWRKTKPDSVVEQLSKEVSMIKNS